LDILKRFLENEGQKTKTIKFLKILHSSKGHERLKEANKHETNIYKIQRWRQQNENVTKI